jgi:ABC-2 type transport system permease protein
MTEQESRSEPSARTEGGSRGARPDRATLTWAVRLVRRGALILAASSAGYMVMEVASYQQTYPHGVSADQFAIFTDNPASRMLQGVPHGVGSAGGFATWDGGWLLELVLGTWAILVVSRLLRGEEETVRGELLLVGPVRATRVTALVLSVITAGGVLAGLSAGVALAATGADRVGSALFGLGLAGFAATFVGLTAVTSQIVDVRRRAASLAAAAFGVSFLLRMLANSTDGRSWMAWLTPFGWMDELQPFGDPAPMALVWLLVTPAVLCSVALWLRERRDTGGAWWVTSDSHPPRLRGLGSPAAFAWRSNQPMLVGWVGGLAAYAFMMGSLLPAMIDFLQHDQDYQRVMRDLGVDVALNLDGVLGVMSLVLGVGFALYAAWRIGAARAEEESGRADNLLARPLTRWRWLTTHVVLTLVGASVLVLMTGLSVWAGALSTGSHALARSNAFQAVLNTGSVVVLVTGLSVLALGLLPRAAVGIPVGVTVGGYVLTLLGPALSWPTWVVDMSPFTHLALVPAEPFDVTSAVVMVVIGCAMAACGVAAFSARDLKGA